VYARAARRALAGIAVAIFALEDGRILEGPSAFAQPCLNVRVRDGRIELQPRR